jgi:hypothetical protein
MKIVTESFLKIKRMIVCMLRVTMKMKALTSAAQPKTD